MKYQIALIRYDSKAGHVVGSVMSTEYSFDEAAKKAEAMNKDAGYVFGGFGLYYKPVRKEVAA